ncbi:MAG: glycosyltransferase family 4 protein, partial [Candidatus Omnitrophota bacterium]
YNGIDISRFIDNYSDKDKVLIRKEYGLKDIATIGLIARISEVKGHLYLIEAFRKVLDEYPQVQLLIIGDGSDKYLDKLKKLSVRLKLEEKVLFHKACEDTVMPLSIIDIFCMPSLQEGLGLSLLEAMAMSKPVIASNVGGIYTLIKDKYNGLLVPPKDSISLAAAMLSLLKDKDTARLMGERSKGLVLEKFSLDSMADKVIVLYKEIKGGIYAKKIK